MARNDRSGIAETDLRPEKQGFDRNIGGTRRGGPPSYFSPYKNDALRDGEDGEYLPERLADEAIAFVKENRGPFFLNWWPFSVHYPLQAPETIIEKYRAKKGIRDPAYAAMIEGMDRAIGRFLNALDDAGMREDTVVIFKSDNGGYNGDNRPLRGYKGMIFEGGIRIPWIVRWPGVVSPGSTCATPVISMDCYPTILQAANVEIESNDTLDGLSILPLLKQTGDLDREAIYFHYPNYAFHKKNRLASAIRQGDHKLIRRYDDGSIELYNLNEDIGETENLAERFPDLAERMEGKLQGWLHEVEAATSDTKVVLGDHAPRETSHGIPILHSVTVVRGFCHVLPIIVRIGRRTIECVADHGRRPWSGEPRMLWQHRLLHSEPRPLGG